MGMVVSITMMGMRLSSRIHDGGRHSQNRKILILNELRDSFPNDPEEQHKPDNNENPHFLFLFLQRGPHYEVRPPGVMFTNYWSS